MFPKKKIPVVQKNIIQRRLEGEPKKNSFQNNSLL